MPLPNAIIRLVQSLVFFNIGLPQDRKVDR
jgi:hypothetical protein